MRDPINLLGVLLVDAGLAAGFLGLVSLIRPLRFLGIRSRRRGAVWLASGVALGLAGVALPAPLRRVSERIGHLDEILPFYQFSEHHEIRVQASPERVYEAVWAVTAEDIRLFRTLTWLRAPRLGESGRESILNAPAKKPILDVATSSGFMLLADQPGREVVVGTIVVAPAHHSRGRLAGPEDYAALEEPGYAKAVMNFRIEEQGGGWTRLTTETRVYATDASARRRFAVYWRVIYPGSALIRRMWLRAIRERAEAQPLP